MKRWIEGRWVLQDEEGSDGGGGAGGDDGGDDDGGEKPPASIPIDVLPEDLRNRPAAEVKFLLQHMIQSLGTQNSEVQTLKQELARLQGKIVDPPKPPDPNDDKPLEELILEDVDAALSRWAEKKGFTHKLGELDSRVGSTEMEMVAGKIDDFEEYREDVERILEETKVPPTRRYVLAAYEMAVGRKAIESKMKKKRGEQTIPPSKPPKDGPKEEPKVSDLEREIAAAHGMSPEDWQKYKDDSPMEIKLPT